MASGPKQRAHKPSVIQPAPVIGEIERELLRDGYRWVVGVDEVGRGPLAGPVTAGGVLLDLHHLSWCDGVRDSKKLSERRRQELEPVIQQHAVAWWVEHVPPQEVDRMNVLQASLWAMHRAVEHVLASASLVPQDVIVLVDGKQALHDYAAEQRTLIKGDARSWSIAGASILAKVARDALMVRMHDEFPAYGFDKHKGYPTKMHLQKLDEHGPCVHHRKSFSPVYATIEKSKRSIS